jgi:hypothetical protein
MLLAADGKALLVRALSIDDEGEQQIYRVSVLNFGSGDLLCELEDCGLLTVAELKWRVEAKTGLDPELTILLHAEHGELKDGVRLTDLVGLPTTELYAQTLMKVSVAQHLGIAPHEVTNDQFTTLCAALVSEPLAIMELKGCTHVRDFSLLPLSLSKLDISDCNLFAEGGKALAAGLKGNQGITELNASNNSLGVDSDYDWDISGIIAIADVIGDGAMTSLNLASNNLSAEGAKIVAEAIKVTKCTPAISMALFSCLSVFSINCCCLLLSAGYEGPIGVVYEQQPTRA